MTRANERNEDDGAAMVDVFLDAVAVRLTPCMSDRAVERVEQDLEAGAPDWVSPPVRDPTSTVAEHIEDVRSRPDETSNRTTLPIDREAVPGGVEAVVLAYLRGKLSLSGDELPSGTAEPRFSLQLQLSVGGGVHSWEVLAVHLRH